MWYTHPLKDSFSIWYDPHTEDENPFSFEMSIKLNQLQLSLFWYTNSMN